MLSITSSISDSSIRVPPISSIASPSLGLIFILLFTFFSLMGLSASSSSITSIRSVSTRSDLQSEKPSVETFLRFCSFFAYSSADFLKLAACSGLSTTLSVSSFTSSLRVFIALVIALRRFIRYLSDLSLSPSLSTSPSSCPTGSSSSFTLARLAAAFAKRRSLAAFCSSFGMVNILRSVFNFSLGGSISYDSRTVSKYTLEISVRGFLPIPLDMVILLLLNLVLIYEIFDTSSACCYHSILKITTSSH